MFLELIATFAAGAGAAGLILAINLTIGGRLPKWTMPAMAGLAMIGVAVSNEMTWGARTTTGMPDGVVVVDEIEQTAWYRPWTYLTPQVVRLVALDTESIIPHATDPDVHLVDLYLYARWQPSIPVKQLVRCSEPARADVTHAAVSDISAASWRPAPDTLIETACKE